MADKHVEEVILPKKTAEQNSRLALNLVQWEGIKAIFGLVIGLICVVGGLALIYAGVEGSIDWSLKGLGLESKLAKASPGALVIVAGVVIIWVTRFSYKVK
jgi:hypothetical protein